MIRVEQENNGKKKGDSTIPRSLEAESLQEIQSVYYRLHPPGVLVDISWIYSKETFADWLVGFYGISTIEGYSIPNPILYTLSMIINDSI